MPSIAACARPSTSGNRTAQGMKRAVGTGTHFLPFVTAGLHCLVAGGVLAAGSWLLARGYWVKRAHVAHTDR